MTTIEVQQQFPVVEIDKGYANRTLYINLTTNTIATRPVTPEMKEKFIGGRGFDLWLMWNALPKRIVKWDDPENEICIGNGPLGGSTLIPGSGKCIVTTISPLTGMIVDSNVGGYFGTYLKQAGFDAFEIQGKAKHEVLIFIDAETCMISIEPMDSKLSPYAHIRTQELTAQYAPLDNDKKRISVITTGPAAKYTNWGVLHFSWYTPHRKWASYKQAGRGGIGTVFMNKGIGAIVIRSPRIIRSINPAQPALLKEVARLHVSEIIENDPKQNELRNVGTGHLPEIMNEYDLFPIENYRFGKHPTIKTEDLPYHREAWKKIFTNSGKGLDNCHLMCPLNCAKYTDNHIVRTGPFKGQKVLVDGPEYETIGAVGSNWGVWDAHWVLEANFYCDVYGIDTISTGTGIAFVMECFEKGILNKEITGGLDLHFGQVENAMELVHQMAKGEGFGVIVGQGIHQMKKIFTENYLGDPKFMQDIGMEHKGLEFSEYISKESLTQQGGYGLTLKGPQHDEAWLIFEDVVRKSLPTFEDKANALDWFPLWRTWFGINGLCKILWNDVNPPENKNNPLKDEHGNLYRARVPKHVEWYTKYYIYTTGREVTTDDMIEDSRRVYNLQRIFNVRQGKGLRENDSNFPYRAMGPVTVLEYTSRAERYDKQLQEIFNMDTTSKSVEEKIAILRKHREEQYSLLQDAVYKKRGWLPNGCPSLDLLKRLGIDFPDVVKVIQPFQ